MRHRYEQKTTSQGSDSEQSSSLENLPQEDPNDFSLSNSPDVTDIFIPVPPLQKGMHMDSNVPNAESSNKGLEVTAEVHISAEVLSQGTESSENEGPSEVHDGENQELEQED